MPYRRRITVYRICTTQLDGRWLQASWIGVRSVTKRSIPTRTYARLEKSWSETERSACSISGRIIVGITTAASNVCHRLVRGAAWVAMNGFRALSTPGLFLDGATGMQTCRRSELIAIAGHQTLQGIPRCADHITPVTRARLTKLPQSRVPGTVVAVQQPAPVSIKTVQEPNRFAKCTGQVGNRRINTDDEVKIDDERSSILEVMKVVGKIVEHHPIWWIGSLSSRSIFL